MWACIAVCAVLAVSAHAAQQNVNARLDHSQDVVAFFEARTWMLAPNQEKCWAVPWQRTCRIARRVYQQHLERIPRLRALLVPRGETQIRAWMVQRVGQQSADCLGAIIDMENPPWDPTIDYGGGHGNVYEAYGLPQAFPGTKMASAGADWRTNPITQIEWMIRYTTERYGSPCGGWASRRDQGTY